MNTISRAESFFLRLPCTKKSQIRITGCWARPNSCSPKRRTISPIVATSPRPEASFYFFLLRTPNLHQHRLEESHLVFGDCVWVVGLESFDDFICRKPAQKIDVRPRFRWRLALFPGHLKKV